MSALQQARAHFDEGAFGKAHEAAVAGLESAPDDVELLRLAGRAGVELGSDDAVDQLRTVATLRPDSAESWRDLADALAAEGRTAEASEAFRKVLEIEPEDELALTALGHAAFQEGKRDDAVSLLEQVAGRSAGASTAAISLVDMYRSLGKPEEALAAARKVAEADPEDALAQLDVAELALETGNLDEAADAFARVRDALDTPDDEVAALHGAIKVELARAQPEQALGLARQASAIDSRRPDRRRAGAPGAGAGCGRDPRGGGGAGRDDRVHAGSGAPAEPCGGRSAARRHARGPARQPARRGQACGRPGPWLR